MVGTVERWRVMRLHGAAEMRKQEMHKKRSSRMRKQLVASPYVSLEWVNHPLNCICYDCLYGEIAEARRALDAPAYDPLAQAEQFHRTGRVARGGLRYSDN